MKLERRRLPHRLVFACALLLIAAFTLAAGAADQPKARFTGQPITLHLHDADFRDVMSTFSKLTNVKIVVDDGINEKVTIVANEKPWDEMLDVVVRISNLRWEITSDKSIHVFR
jgi:type II secretory pathway component HofQ